jgi:hypothetical protein
MISSKSEASYNISYKAIMDTSTTIILAKKPSRKEIQAKVRAEKARAKLERKAAFRHKTEKKLREKEERKIFHKKENAQKKYQKKVEKRV